MKRLLRSFAIFLIAVNSQASEHLQHPDSYQLTIRPFVTGKSGSNQDIDIYFGGNDGSPNFTYTGSAGANEELDVIISPHAHPGDVFRRVMPFPYSSDKAPSLLGPAWRAEYFSLTVVSTGVTEVTFQFTSSKHVEVQRVSTGVVSDQHTVAVSNGTTQIDFFLRPIISNPIPAGKIYNDISTSQYLKISLGILPNGKSAGFLAVGTHSHRVGDEENFVDFESFGQANAPIRFYPYENIQNATSSNTFTRSIPQGTVTASVVNMSSTWGNPNGENYQKMGLKFVFDLGSNEVVYEFITDYYKIGVPGNDPNIHPGIYDNDGKNYVGEDEYVFDIYRTETTRGASNTMRMHVFKQAIGSIAAAGPEVYELYHIDETNHFYEFRDNSAGDPNEGIVIIKEKGSYPANRVRYFDWDGAVWGAPASSTTTAQTSVKVTDLPDNLYDYYGVTRTTIDGEIKYDVYDDVKSRDRLENGKINPLPTSNPILSTNLNGSWERYKYQKSLSSPYFGELKESYHPFLDEQGPAPVGIIRSAQQAY
ncbi:MAG: hypothetical protein MK130_07320 [Puniceicoccaceae bacterium]|nr:hypothetical protein [Puniceicoccaceae bacterium]NRA27004.1 hypothetical protein [Opitutales bacterium]